MRPRPIRHAVWPTGAPPVPTSLWGQKDWDTYAEGFRPSGYSGGAFDEEAWKEYQEARARTKSLVLRAEALPNEATAEVIARTLLELTIACGVVPADVLESADRTLSTLERWLRRP